MHSNSISAANKDYYPSLAGVGLLADILPDLPLPTYLPTPLETTVLGQGELRNESRRLLNSTDPQLYSQITKALSTVDTSFLKLKVTPPKQGYRPDVTSPALIKNLLKTGLPKIHLPKVDINQYNAAPKKDSSFQFLPESSPFGQQDISFYSSPSTNEKKPSSSVRSVLREISATPTLGTKRPRELSPRSGEPLKKKQRKRKPNSLIVSINKKLISPPSKPPKSSSKKGSKRRLSSKGSSDSDIHSNTMTVSIPRRKLPGHNPPLSSLYAPSYPHHHDPRYMSTNERPGLHGYSYPNRSFSGGNANSDISMHSGFVMDPNAEDQIVPHKKEKKKKKHKHHHHRHQDPSHLIHIQRFTQIIESILEHIDHTDSDDLLSKHSISQLLSETVRLKQLGYLHEVHTDVLVKLISVMDKHVLDTASLLMSAVSDEMDPKVWRELARERILRSLDAGLVILHITTAPHIPSHVQLEESIDQLISHTKYHLENNIYPEFDPVYRAEAKESGALPRQKRRYTSSTTNKAIMAVYHRMVEVIDTLSQLLQTQSLTDITILKLSGLGVFPFFVENVSTLQLSALKLVRTIFSRYEKHRELILEDIFASLARLPTTKRNLRSFRLTNGQSIQMVTALILQLVQCMVLVPNTETKTNTSPGNETNTNKSKVDVAVDVAMISSYELALRTGSNFLSTFLKKCCSGKEEDDFRPLFDNFVHDLLTTLSLPEWPSSEVLLTLLGVLLVQAFSNRSNEQQLRLTSLDHLGVIAARLRKDAISSVKENHEELIDILSEVMQNKLDNISPLPSPTELDKMDAFSENARHLRKTLIAFLTSRSKADPSYAYAKDFYLGQWLRENQVELEKTLQSTTASSPDHLPDPLMFDDITNENKTILDPTSQAVHHAELTKDFLVSLLQPMSPSKVGSLAGILDDRKAALVTRYLASERTLSKSFDIYLQHLLRVLNEPAVHVRTRAMKALSTIVAADPNILSRPELQRAVHYRFSDSSTLMREAAVDLVGRFVLIQPDLTPQYYQMLLERILDTGVSVRKRVIKILKDICVNQPEFDKITEICVKMIRRINDEEGIKQLVTSIFHQLWFTLPTVDMRQQLMKRVSHVTEVVSKSVNEQECFEQLLQQLFKNEETSKSVLEVCQLMVDSLMERVLSLDESSEQKTSRCLVDCITTLFLFSKIRPSFLIHHAKTLQPYLSSQCSSQEDIFMVHYVARILEAVVPLLTRPTETFLNSLEEDLVKLIMKQGPMIVQSCVACLAVVVNKVSKNYKLVNDCYTKFYTYLEKVQLLHRNDPKSPQLASVKPSVLRSLFTVGLFCKHFDMDTISSETKDSRMSERVYSLLVFFSRHEDEEVQIKALIGLGFHCVRYPEMMLHKEAKDLYFSYLSPEASLKMKCQVIKNLQTHLMELESTLKEADANRKKEESDNLMELGDQHSSVSSNIAQMYLPSILETYYTTEVQVRLSATQTILLILRQGLVHPGQCVPHLITLSTDTEQQIRLKAEQQLSEYSSRFGGFMQTHLTTGLKRAYHFQQLLSASAPRGFSEQNGGSPPNSLLAHLYTLVRSSKPQRRAFLKTILRPFEEYDQHTLGMLLFLADNLVTFPYLVFEEPLFVLHNIDLTLSVTGASILQSFREALGKTGLAAADDEEDDDIEKLSQQSYNLLQLNECCRSSLGCILLLILKQHLRQTFNLSEKKCQEYTPNENNKTWDKAVSRRQGLSYDPVIVITEVEKEVLGKRTQHGKEECLKLYMHFKRLMNRLDPFEGEDEDEDIETGPVGTGGGNVPPTVPIVPPQEPNEPQQQESISSLVSVLPETLSSTIPHQRRSRSRASSTSSSNSTGSRSKKHKKNNETKTIKKKRARVLSDDSDSDNNPDFNMK